MLFGLNGVTISMIVPRYPEIKAAMSLSDGAFGIAVGIGPLGGLIGALLTARAIRRWSSADVAVRAQALTGLAVLAITVAPRAWWLSAALVAASFLDAFTDVSMNAHGMRVQRLYGRSIINSFHGWWSVGAVVGGLIGSVLAQVHLVLWAHGLLALAVTASVSLTARRFLLPGGEDDERAAAGGASADQDPARGAAGGAPDAPPRGRAAFLVPLFLRIIALGLIGAFAGMIEDMGSTWGAIYMTTEFAALPFLAGLAFVALQGAQTIGRLTGDAVVVRLGDRGTARLGSLVGAGGMVIALVVPSPPTTLLGFACAGWGIATLIPAAFHTADEIRGLPSGLGIALAGWIMRVGFFASPPLIGALSDAFTLRKALWVAPIALIGVLVLSGVLTRRERLAGGV